MTQTPQLALGVVSAPASEARRNAARGSWLRDAAVLDGRVAVRFVLGSSAASSSDHDDYYESAAAAAKCRDVAEAALRASPRDVLLVDAPDCNMWHSPAKVHAWFQAALVAFPNAQWLGKTEDDAMLWASALLTDLHSLPPAAQYYGVMAWQGSCRSAVADVDEAASSAALTAAALTAANPLTAPVECSGCYAGALANGVGMCRAAHCRAGGTAANGRRCCQVGCPRTVRMAPFAIGALDVRARPLAASVARCGYATRYFRWLSRLGMLRGALCATTDGSQGHAIHECVARDPDAEPMELVDATNRRLSDGIACRNAGRSAAASGAHGSARSCGGAVMLHPLKRSDAAGWNDTWRGLTQARGQQQQGSGGMAHHSLPAYAPLPLVHASVSTFADARRLPALRLLGEIGGPAGGNNASISVAWAERDKYMFSVVQSYRDRHRTAATSQFTADLKAGAKRTKMRQMAQRHRQQRRRRLRSESIWALNCSRLWAA